MIFFLLLLKKRQEKALTSLIVFHCTEQLLRTVARWNQLVAWFRFSIKSTFTNWCFHGPVSGCRITNPDRRSSQPITFVAFVGYVFSFPEFSCYNVTIFNWRRLIAQAVAWETQTHYKRTETYLHTRVFPVAGLDHTKLDFCQFQSFFCLFLS